MKPCTLCDVVKPFEDFVKDKSRPNGVSSWCKECHRRKRRQHYAANPPTREEMRNQQIKFKYGLSEADQLRLFAEQGGKCGICAEPFRSMLDTRVDHDHETGKVRGLPRESEKIERF